MKFNNAAEAEKSLILLGFMKKNDPYIELCKAMLVFLCNEEQFNKTLASVSAFIWSCYTGLDPMTKNKFSRSLASVATQNGFRVSSRPIRAPHPDALPKTALPSPGTMDIKLVGSYGDFYGLLNDRMFWKDSMDMEHGEYSHALQWLALAFEFGPRAAAFYAELPNYHSSSKTGGIPLWSYLADCFPDTKKADEHLISNTYRSPQMITKHLIGGSKPIKGHFLSFYLTYIYKQRNLVSYDKTSTGNIKANYGSSSNYALDSSREQNWKKVTENGKTPGSKVITRLDRAEGSQRDATKTEQLKVSFHNIEGKFWTKGDLGIIYEMNKGTNITPQDFPKFD